MDKSHFVYKKYNCKRFRNNLRARKFFIKKTLLLYFIVLKFGEMQLDPLIKLQKKIIRVITYSQYLAHTNDLFVQLQILPFKKLVIHRIGLQMFKNNLGYISKAVESLFYN